MDSERQAVLLVGCGRMGGALARSWVGEHDVYVYDPNADLPAGAIRVEHIEGAALPVGVMVVLAVKPQTFEAAAAAVVPLADRGAPILSIMAGVTLAALCRRLGPQVIRSMPNTPAAIGQGITALVAAPSVPARAKRRAEELLYAAGKVVWLDDEASLDAVTAVSGSGPAYFFRFTEALAAAGVAAGLPLELSMELARSTLIGSAALAAERREPLDVLRAEVTSPGGTTAAGLMKLANGGIDDLLATVVNAAAARSRDLSGATWTGAAAARSRSRTGSPTRRFGPARI